MGCSPEKLRAVPLFSLLDDDELAVLGGQVEIKNFVPRQRIYKMGDDGGHAYVIISGKVRVSIIDDDHHFALLEIGHHRLDRVKSLFHL